MLFADQALHTIHRIVIKSVVSVQALSFEGGVDFTWQEKGIGVFWV